MAGGYYYYYYYFYYHHYDIVSPEANCYLGSTLVHHTHQLRGDLRCQIWLRRSQVPVFLVAT